MLGSMFSGISGLLTNTQSLNVIGNNIANVNTVGYKGSRTTFADLLYQSVNGTAGSSQVGRGSTLAAVETSFAQGSFESTNEATDLAIGGDGFFIVKSSASDSTEYYTRAGQFSFDKEGYLTNSEGLILQGKQIDSKTQKAVGVDTNVNISQKPSDPKMTSSLDMSVNLQSTAEWKGSIDAPEGLGTSVSSITNTLGKWPIAGDYKLDVTKAGDVYTLKVTVQRVGPDGVLTGDPIEKSKVITAGQSYSDFEGLGITINTADALAVGSQTLDISGFNVDDPTRTSNYSSSITVYDSNGQSHVVTTYFRKSHIDGTGNSIWEWMSVVGAADAATATNTMSSSGDLTFNTSGVLQGEGSNHKVLYDFASAQPDQPITISFGTLSAVSGENTKDAMTQYPIDSTTNYQAQDGYPPGTLTGVSVNSDGIISGTYSNGQTMNLFQITLANFSDPAGLTKVGSNLFSANNETGDAYKYAPGVSGTGKINPNSLEQSNVDLATEFVKLIVAQRGFQANSRVITTSDEVLQELMNLKR